MWITMILAQIKKKSIHQSSADSIVQKEWPVMTAWDLDVRFYYIMSRKEHINDLFKKGNWVIIKIFPGTTYTNDLAHIDF